MSEAALKNRVKMKNRFSINVIIHSFLFYLIVAVLLFSGITKIIDPLPLIKTLEAIKLSSFTS